MSAFGSFDRLPTGSTAYMTVRNKSTGQWFKPGTGFANLTTTRSDFDNPMEESPAGTGQFVLTSAAETALLAALVAGTEYEWTVWIQTGGSSSHTNDSDEYEGEGVYAGSSVFRTIITGKLGSDGLDSIAVTRPSAVATTFPGMVVQLFYRFFGKVTKTSGNIKNYAANGTSVVTDQTISDSAGTQTQGEAS